MSILTRESFRAMRETAEEALRRSSNAVNVLVCAGTGCIAGGSLKVCETLKEECERRGLQVYVGLTEHSGEEKSLHIKMSGCHGFCEMGPLVHIEPLGVMYIHVKPEDCCEIVEKTVMRGEIIERLTYQRDGVSYPRQEDIPFYKKQKRVVLETSGNTETSTGNISSGVTAASAIAALQEASGKGSRDSTRSSYVAYAQIVELCIELIRQFYGLPRSFRIAGRAGAEEYIRFSNAGLCPRPQPFGAALPVFDVKVSAQKRNAYSRLSQNELAMELYRMGIFDEGKEQEALSCLRMMEFDGRDELIGRITASMGLREKLDELQKYKALALAFARRYRPDMAEGLGVAVDPSLGAPSEAAAAPLGAPSRGAGTASATEGSPDERLEQSEKDTDPAALAALLPPPHLP